MHNCEVHQCMSEGYFAAFCICYRWLRSLYERFGKELTNLCPFCGTTRCSKYLIKSSSKAWKAKAFKGLKRRLRFDIVEMQGLKTGASSIFMRYSFGQTLINKSKSSHYFHGDCCFVDKLSTLKYILNYFRIFKSNKLKNGRSFQCSCTWSTVLS